jgi:hypothetical protein
MFTALCLTCALTVCGVGAVPASAASLTVLPDGFEAVVVDAATSHVFVSSVDSSTVTVLDLSGNIVKVIEDVPGAAGMVVVGETLYVSLMKAGAIDAIDTTTLVRTRRLAEDSLSQPRPLVFAAGRLWTTSGELREKRLAAIDPATGRTC